MTSPLSSLSWSAPFDGDLSDDLALALRLADAADAVAMARFDADDLRVSVKADASFVTEADLATEKAIRDLLAAERPDDGVFGEEFGASGSETRQWVIDPIDGTSNYLKGIPMWATLIALVVDGVPRVGVVEPAGDRAPLVGSLRSRRLDGHGGAANSADSGCRPSTTWHAPASASRASRSGRTQAAPTLSSG